MSREHNIVDSHQEPSHLYEMGAFFLQLRSLPRHFTFGGLAFITVVLLLLLTMQLSHVELTHYTPSYSSASPEEASQPAQHDGGDYGGQSLLIPDDIGRVTNDSLGFSKIFVVGLPERTDKRDAMALTSSLTGFHVEWVDGVRGEDVPDKAVPYGVDRKKLWENNLGSWRGHMNAVRSRRGVAYTRIFADPCLVRIVEEKLESALIMEDDMDWDVGLKSQLEKVARGARELFESAPNPISPYGDGWDVLWLGHCGEVFPELLDENRKKAAEDAGLRYMQRKFIIENDPTVPPRDKLTGIMDFRQSPEGTRWVHITGAPICTFAYALSHRGARKVLFDLSVDHLGGPFDNSLASLCRRAVSAVGDPDTPRAGDRGLDTKCISVTPPVFFHHKAKGNLAGDSDIQTVADGAVRDKGFTENIMWSARNNIRNMIMGTQMESQFGERPGESR